MSQYPVEAWPARCILLQLCLVPVAVPTVRALAPVASLMTPGMNHVCKYQISSVLTTLTM